MNQITLYVGIGVTVWLLAMGLMVLLSALEQALAKQPGQTGAASVPVVCEPVDLEDGQIHYINGDWDE